MSYGIKLPSLLPAFAVSIVLHGVAMALWSNSVQSVHIDSPTAVETLTVTLTTLPSRSIEDSEKQLPNPEKQNVTTQPVTSALTKLPPNKLVASKQPHKSSAKAKQPPSIKKTKPPVRNPVKTYEIFPNNLIDQRVDTRNNKTIANNNLNSLPAGSLSPLHEPSATESKAEPSNDQTRKNKLSSPVAQQTATKFTNKLAATSAVLPPLLKSRQPDYPEEARWEERTGKVTVKFKISERGRVLEANISNSSGHRDLDLAAIRAIQYWQFDAKEDLSFSQWFYYSFRFELN